MANNVRVRAVILVDGKLLLIHRVKTDADYWVFPGGGVEEADASHVDAVIRECREELGVQVSVGEEVLRLSSTLAGEVRKEVFYRCEITGGELGTGDGPEFQPESGYKGDYQFDLLNLDQVTEMDVRPNEALEVIRNLQ